MEWAESAVEGLPLGVIVARDDGTLAGVNGRARELLRLRAGDAAPAWLDAVLARALERGAALRETVELPAAAGPPPAVEVAAAPVRGGVVCTVEDLTVRTRRERADREFITNAAHQLRTPIAAIATAVEVLQGGAKEDPATRDRFLGHIELQTERLVRLAKAMLVLARVERGDAAAALGLVPLRPLLAGLVAEFDEAPELVLELDCPAELAVWADGALLSEALANVLTNALEHTSSGAVRVAAHAGDGTVAIEVVDTGSGIAPAELPRVFERFRSGAGEGGVGLGLPIARAALAALGGSIEIHSREGAGTTVQMRLPGAAPSVLPGPA
ncbi:MAG: two-component system, OmpR family, phosphate regulon sensor histidine kinase PhoR [Actinomycetota bacterium]|jgi:signal transduction histidine kinase